MTVMLNPASVDRRTNVVRWWGRGAENINICGQGLYVKEWQLAAAVAEGAAAPPGSKPGSWVADRCWPANQPCRLPGLPTLHPDLTELHSAIGPHSSNLLAWVDIMQPHAAAAVALHQR